MLCFARVSNEFQAAETILYDCKGLNGCQVAETRLRGRKGLDECEVAETILRFQGSQMSVWLLRQYCMTARVSTGVGFAETILRLQESR